MKRELSPAIVTIVIVVVVAVVGFFVWKGTASGPGSKAPGEVGNPGPFSPGGAAVNKGGRPAAATGVHGRPGG